jgi:hypothetical protein
MCSLLVRSVCVLIGLATPEGLARTLPVFLSDNHAETFGWITRRFDPDTPHHLVLVDAHSDASAAERSEEIREGLRRVPSLQAREANVTRWRNQGRVQAFNWIEPLMPRPLEHIHWLAAPQLSAPQREELHAEAISLLDGRSEVEPRSSGSFAGRWTTVDLAGFKQLKPSGRPVILAIDLDFFAGMEPGLRESSFETIWRHAMDWPDLAGVAFAVSRPWLKSDEEADALVALACGAVMRTRGAVMEIDASLDDRPDDSKLRSETKAALVRWDVLPASTMLRARLLQLRDRLEMVDRRCDWEPILDSWENEAAKVVMQPERGEIDCDGVWRFSDHDAPVIRLTPPPGATGRVRWFALEPSRSAYDLLPHTGLGKSFAESPARWIYDTRRSLGDSGDFALSPEKWRPGGPGRVRLEAELETGEGWIPVQPIEVRLAAGNGFRAAISECFHMPYVFGIAAVEEKDLSGVETGWGADCSNLLIHAWRRNGIPLAWGDPGRMRIQLATKAENVTLADAVPIAPDEIETGIAIDFGKHVAAIWEDRDPIGKLSVNDRVVHHLGGFPEVVELAALTATRPRFSLRVPHPSTGDGCLVKIAGDVVLAGEQRETIPSFEKQKSDLFIANLEGIPSLREPNSKVRYDFRFPSRQLPWLRERGIDAVSLANNHAGDAGRNGLLEGMRALRDHGIGFFGAGKNAAEACQPWRVECRGVRIAVFGVCLVDSLNATVDLAGVASLPAHAQHLEAEIRKAKAAGELVIVMVHGGDEYRQSVNDTQRRWARWLVKHGANRVVGAHPHVVQRTEHHGGAIIDYSLGNAVYPKTLKGADSGKILQLHFQPDGSTHENKPPLAPNEPEHKRVR